MAHHRSHRHGKFQISPHFESLNICQSVGCIYIYISHAILVISLYQSISFISLPGPTCMLRFTPAPQRNTPVLSHHQEQQPQLTPAAKASSSPTAWFISRWLPSGNLAWPWHFPWHVPQFSRWHSQFSIASGWDFSATFDYHGGRHLGKDSQRGCARTLWLSQPFFPAGCLMKRKVNPHWRTNGYIVDHYLLINGMPNLSLYFPKGH